MLQEATDYTTLFSRKKLAQGKWRTCEGQFFSYKSHSTIGGLQQPTLGLALLGRSRLSLYGEWRDGR